MTNTEYIGMTSLQNLQLHVHVIGYYPQGECILVILYDKAKRVVVKSILIDCFVSKNQEDQLRKKLDEYGISAKTPLDMIIWTHPDKDHSEGLGEIVARYTNKKTFMVLPDGFFLKTLKRAGLKLTIQLLLSLFRNGFSMERVNTSTHRKNSEEYMSLQFDDGVMDSIEYSVEILTPNGAQVIRKVDGRWRFYKNDISISMIIHCGELDLYFGGDVENDAIKMVPDYKMSKVCFVKIPHHASDTSTELYEVIKRNISLKKLNNEDLIDITAVSTCFHIGRKPAPHISVLREYKPISRELCLTDNQRPREDKYGVCSFVYDVAARDYESCYEGDAGIWEE